MNLANIAYLPIYLHAIHANAFFDAVSYEMLEHHLGMNSMCEPGTHFIYNNTGKYLILLSKPKTNAEICLSVSQRVGVCMPIDA